MQSLGNQILETIPPNLTNPACRATAGLCLQNFDPSSRVHQYLDTNVQRPKPHPCCSECVKYKRCYGLLQWAMGRISRLARRARTLRHLRVFVQMLTTMANGTTQIQFSAGFRSTFTASPIVSETISHPHLCHGTYIDNKVQRILR